MNRSRKPHYIHLIIYAALCCAWCLRRDLKQCPRFLSAQRNVQHLVNYDRLWRDYWVPKIISRYTGCCYIISPLTQQELCLTISIVIFLNKKKLLFYACIVILQEFLLLVWCTIMLCGKNLHNWEAFIQKTISMCFLCLKDTRYFH